MPKRRSTTTIPSLKGIDRDGGQVGRQLAQGLRDAVATGSMKPGERLPSTRDLATSLGVARSTVVEVFEQLVAEGYLDARVGAGTRVATTLADQAFVTHANTQDQSAVPVPVLPPAAAKLAAVAGALAPLPSAPFSIAVPASGVAPDDTWRRLGNRVRATAAAAPASYGDPRGLRELREAICEHVRRARAVRCTPDQVVITAGIQQGLFMAGLVLLSAGDPVWAEDPAYPGLVAVLDAIGARTHRVPVDAHGICVEVGVEACPGARAAFVTPSHQYPLGMPLGMSRRMALIRWARQRDAWIVEDDYDSELRYSGHPFPSMQGLDPSRVVYLGTLSKVLFPSLRLGYVIVPGALVEAFAGARAILDRHSPTTEQHVLAAYMREGLFEAHIRRIRGLYAERRSVLLAALTKEMPAGFSVQPSDQGMHVVLWVPPGTDDVGLSRRALDVGLAVRPISPMYAAANPGNGLMLGFGGFTPTRLGDAVARLAQAVRDNP